MLTPCTKDNENQVRAVRSAKNIPLAGGKKAIRDYSFQKEFINPFIKEESKEAKKIAPRIGEQFVVKGGRPFGAPFKI